MIVNQAETMEQTFWASVKDCGDYRAYLNKYPGGEFTELAKLRLAAPLCNVSDKPVTWDPGLSAPAKSASVALCDMKASSQWDRDCDPANSYVDVVAINSADVVGVC